MSLPQPTPHSQGLRPSKRAPTRPSLPAVLRAFWLGSALLTLLPLLAVVRALLDLVKPGAVRSTSAVGLALAVTALLLGTLFFAFSIRYYLASALGLFLSMTSNGHAQQVESFNAGRAGRIARRVAGNGDGNGGFELGYFPFVSVHIAAFNERRVIERLLNACAALDYPAYEVILVDDSTDGSADLVAKWTDVPGFKILHRDHRFGFKGGALGEALKVMDRRTEFVVVLDADALPFPDMIRRFLPYFYTNGGLPPERISDIAAVQSYQWHVLNKSESWLTEAIRAEYAGSYMVERPFQQVVGALKMIAGTAYMIRADLLRELGWGRSLTEDWELTLRLYERGYKVIFTPYAETPAECVSTFARLARQRMRWAEGHSYNVRKWFWRVLRSSSLSLTEKAEFLFLSIYYLQAVLFIAGTVAWLTSELLLRTRIPAWSATLGWSLLFTNLLALPLMNAAGLLLEDAPPRDFTGVCGALALSFLLVPFQAWAAIKGLVERHEGPWFRTPKTGVVTDAVHHLRQLRQLKRWLKGRRSRPPSGRFPPAAAIGARRSGLRGWTVAASLVLAIGVIGALGLHAPVAYANPDQLYLRNATSSVNANDQTLDVQGPLLATMAFSNGTIFTWLSSTSYTSGTVTSGTYTIKLDWATNTCGALGGSNCSVTVTWGYCKAGCTALQPAAATFAYTLTSASGSVGSSTSSVTGSAITLSGCPCNFYVSIASASSTTATWTLAYNGNVLVCTSQCDDTNIQTPALPVSERVVSNAGVALLAPMAGWPLARMLRRRGRTGAH